MDFYKGLTYKKQQSIVDGYSYSIIGMYHIRKMGNAFQFYKKVGVTDQLIESYVTTYYVYPRCRAIVIFNGEKWKRYLYKDNLGAFELEYVSNYFIVSFNNNLLIKKTMAGLAVCNYDDNGTELIIRKVLTGFTNFAIDEEERKIYFLNEVGSRKLVYDLKTDEVDDRIMRLPRNTLKCKNTVAYFDKLGGIEIYNNSDKLQLSSSRYYKLEKFLYVIVVDTEYIVIDLYRNVKLFVGQVLHIINSSGWLIDKRKDEIIVISDKNLQIMSYSKYKVDDKTPYKTHLRDKFKN